METGNEARLADIVSGHRKYVLGCDQPYWKLSVHNCTIFYRARYIKCMILNCTMALAREMVLLSAAAVLLFLANSVCSQGTVACSVFIWLL